MAAIKEGLVEPQLFQLIKAQSKYPYLYIFFNWACMQLNTSDQYISIYKPFRGAHEEPALAEVGRFPISFIDAYAKVIEEVDYTQTGIYRSVVAQFVTEIERYIMMNRRTLPVIIEKDGWYKLLENG